MTEKFEFIDAEYAVYQESDDVYVPSIVKMCWWMEVSRSGFYEWRSAPESATVKKHNLRQSAGRTGICYDNAMAESFFAALKNERVHRTQYPTREHARRDVVRYIEFWYNPKRRHSGLQYRTPQQVHEEYLERQSAA